MRACVWEVCSTDRRSSSNQEDRQIWKQPDLLFLLILYYKKVTVTVIVNGCTATAPRPWVASGAMITHRSHSTQTTARRAYHAGHSTHVTAHRSYHTGGVITPESEWRQGTAPRQTPPLTPKKKKKKKRRTTANGVH